MLHIDGSVFSTNELALVTAALDALDTRGRLEYLSQNAKAVSSSALERILVVSGPGTGKTTLFTDRIEYWGTQYDGMILVTTFVKKLATDLNNQLLSPSSRLSEERKASVQPTTLHALARSIMEKAMPWNGFRKHVHVVPNAKWDRLIWNDAASDGPEREAWKDFDQDRARATNPLQPSLESTAARYRQLCRYYNAASFSEMILLAQQALQANPELFTCDCVIVDELQDFNKLERCLLETILRNAHSWLMAGDDDQVLYDELKQSTRDLIVDMYNDQSVAKAMLPLCTRCDNHIVHAAAAFMQQCRVGDGQCIEKAFIPARTEPSSRVHMVCCSTASSTFEYLKVYLEGITDKLQDRLSALSRNDPEITDPYLLILTPNKTCRMLGKGGRDQLMQLISPYKASAKIHTESYYTIQECLTWEQNPNDNWLCRRVLAWCKSIDESSGRAAAQESFAKKIPLSTCERECMARARGTCGKLRSLIEDHDLDARSKAKSMADLVWIEDVEGLAEEIESGNLNPEISPDAAYSDEMAASERNDPTALSAAELLTITGSKGLSADEVIILGFDQMNMAYIKERAMYVALTRARHHLTLITTLGGGASSLPRYFDMLPESDLEFFKFAKTTGGLKSFATRWAYKHYVDMISGHKWHA
ncbi:UvrD-helicase domain-containing protein [bacterium]|nr:UvrD-helicase domain-containing protein [bacterium]